MGQKGFLEAGSDDNASAVRPLCASDTKGLSPFGVYETIHGEYMPEDEADRQAEMSRVDLPEDAREDAQMEEE